MVDRIHEKPHQRSWRLYTFAEKDFSAGLRPKVERWPSGRGTLPRAVSRPWPHLCCGCGGCETTMAGHSPVIDLTADSPPLRPRTRTFHTSVPQADLDGRPRHQAESSVDDDVSILGVHFSSPRSQRAHRRRIPLSGSAIPVSEDPLPLPIHDGIAPGPYTQRHSRRSSALTSASRRHELLERLEMLASRYVERSHSGGLSHQTLLRPHAPAHAHPVPYSNHAIPSRFDPAWTHPHPPVPPFAHSLEEPAVDVEAYAAGQHDAVVPLPNKTPICAMCRRALVLNGSGDQRIWALPCGHVLDGRCVSQLSHTKPDGPHVFLCPVAHCKQRCHPESGHAHSCIEVYI